MSAERNGRSAVIEGPKADVVNASDAGHEGVDAEGAKGSLWASGIALALMISSVTSARQIDSLAERRAVVASEQKSLAVEHLQPELGVGVTHASSAATPLWAPGETTRVSVSSSGAQGNGISRINSAHEPTRMLSSDGRFVAFTSSATNLVAGDTNGQADVFVHDRLTHTTERVSVSSAGVQANADCFDPAISGDGRFVVFESESENLVPGGLTWGGPWIYVRDRLLGTTSYAEIRNVYGDLSHGSHHNASISDDGRYIAFASGTGNLVPGDTNEDSDIFVLDRTTGMTTRVSVDSQGTQGDGDSTNPLISANGRFVAFESLAPNWGVDPADGWPDVYLHDRVTGALTVVSADGPGTGGGQTLGSGGVSVSSDGRYVAFCSGRGDLVLGDTNLYSDVFVFDRTTGATTRVSVDSAGVQGDWDSFTTTAISGDGRYVAFYSIATNLVPGDFNDAGDVFVHDRTTGETTRVSVDSVGGEAEWGAYDPAISAGGQCVAFASGSTNLVTGDTNGVADVFVNCKAVAPVQTVTVTASDATAAEPSNAARFTVTRSIVTSASLPVGFQMLGSALNETDYALNVNGTVAIPGGAPSAVVTLTPVDDLVGEPTESATLALLASGDYTLGAASYATATIADNDGGPTSCVPGATRLCLLGGRFRATVAWRKPDQTTGSGQVLPLTTDSGLFWFFSPNNIEFLVKVLDGCSINNRVWVYGAASTDVEYTLTVTDTMTVAVRTYFNPQHNRAPAITDSSAFASCGTLSPSPAAAPWTQGEVLQRETTRELGAASAGLGPTAPMACAPGATRHCLNDGRFEVAVDWVKPDGTPGSGQAVALTADSGLFWFFSANNVEFLVKVLDGCGINNRYWVYGAASTDVQYTLTVTDTQAGVSKSYFNPQHNRAPAITDSAAFATCP